MIRSLHGKLIIGATLISSIVLVIFLYSFLKQKRQWLEDVHKQIFTEHSDMILKSLSYQMLTNDMHALKDKIVKHTLEQNVNEIILLNSKGEVVVSSSEKGSYLDTMVVAFDTTFAHDDQYIRINEKNCIVINRIRNKPACFRCHAKEQKTLGYLKVHYTFIPEGINKFGLYNLIIGSGLLFIFLLAITLWMFQHLLIRRPLRNLMNAIQRVKEGDLSVRVNVVGSDEISRIQESFNELVQKLDKANKELKVFHDKEMEKVERLATAGELASGIAHEIKNPLAGISSTIQVMLENRLQDSIRSDILTEMLIQIQRIEKAVKDLLSYACPPLPELKLGDLNDNIKRCIAFVSPIAEQQDTMIEKELDYCIPHLLMDSTLIDQVIVNICINALQALGKGGTIRIKSEYDKENEIARVRIEDNGPGIPEDIQKNIFRPFYTTKHKGSGLGLSICKKNIERHLGTLKVESLCGEGSVFTFTLPVNTTLSQLTGEE